MSKKAADKKPDGPAPPDSLATSLEELQTSMARHDEITDKRIRRLEKIVVQLYKELLKSDALEKS